MNIESITAQSKCPYAKDRNRFLRRHPMKCTARKEFNKQLAAGTRCVDADLAVGEEFE